MDPNNAEDVRITQLCQSAFHKEHYRDWPEAVHLHSQAITDLAKIVDDASFFDRERKRVARKQIKFHQARLQYIKPLKEGTEPSIILPTSISAQEELQAVRDGQHLALSLEELLLSKFEKAKAANPTHQPDPALAPLLKQPVPHFAPTLDSKKPPHTYHIYTCKEPMTMGSNLYYFKVKSDTPVHQTLYVLQAPKRSRYQIQQTTLHRSTEFLNPCARVLITPVRTTDALRPEYWKGRPLQVFGLTGRPVTEQPDRLERVGWGPRRFSYGGRNFVWMTESGNGKDEYPPQTLYEVSKVWPKAGSRTGKKEHSVIGPKISWGEGKLGLSKCGKICIADGVDQLFREYILAVQLTRTAIVIYGHD